MKASTLGNNPTIVEGIGELEDIWEVVRQGGYGIDRIRMELTTRPETADDLAAVREHLSPERSQASTVG